MSSVSAAAAAPGGPTADAPKAVGPIASPPAPHVVNLHRAFESAARHTTTGTIAGVVPPTTERFSKATAHSASGCKEPDCDLSWQGGSVQHSPHVYLLLWGPNWTTSSPAYAYMYYLYDGLGVTADDSWSTVTSQYGDGSGNPGFSGAVLAGAYQDSSTPPDPVTPDNLATEAYGLASQLGITDLADTQIVVASQSGTCFSDGFAGSCGAPNTNGFYCGWHSYAISSSGDLPFTNLPYQLDAGSLCGENWINSGTGGEYDGFTTIGGHEYAETITDPYPDSGWVDTLDTISGGGEIGDKCVWGGSNFGLNDPAGDLTLSTGTFAMQSLWSNAADRCVMTSAPRLSVSNPGTQKSTLGKGVSLQIHASSNTYTALSYAASGLPNGLSINKTTGRITGTPNTTAGTWKPTVTVSDYAGSAKAGFTWQVSSGAGAVKGYDAKCVDDSSGRTANGNKIDLWTCTGKAPQKITFAASGELQVVGKCITAGTTATLQPCTGSTAQTWTRRGNGEYVVKSTGRCLTDPSDSKTNGTQLRLNGCTNAADQHWSLP